MALTRKKITVRGKSGKTFQRSVMVRAGEAVKRTAGKVGRFVNKHKGKIAAVAGAAALAGAAYLGVKHGKHVLAKGRSAYAATTHPDRVAQGHDNSHAAGVKAASEARRKAAVAPIRNAVASVKSAGSAVAARVRSAAAAPGNAVERFMKRGAQASESARVNARARRTRRSTTLQLGSGN